MPKVISHGRNKNIQGFLNSFFTRFTNAMAYNMPNAPPAERVRVGAFLKALIDRNLPESERVPIRVLNTNTGYLAQARGLTTRAQTVTQEVSLPGGPGMPKMFRRVNYIEIPDPTQFIDNAQKREDFELTLIHELGHEYYTRFADKRLIKRWNNGQHELMADAFALRLAKHMNIPESRIRDYIRHRAPVFHDPAKYVRTLEGLVDDRRKGSLHLLYEPNFDNVFLKKKELRNAIRSINFERGKIYHHDPRFDKRTRIKSPQDHLKRHIWEKPGERPDFRIKFKRWTPKSSLRGYAKKIRARRLRNAVSAS